MVSLRFVPLSISLYVDVEWMYRSDGMAHPERERERMCVCVSEAAVSDVFFSFRSCLENAHKLLPDDLLYFILPVKIFSLNAKCFKLAKFEN